MNIKFLLQIASALILLSCGEKTPEVTGPPAPVNPPVIVEDIVVPIQNNIVTPEFWSAFETDMKVVFFYSKLDTLQAKFPKEKEMTKAFCDANGVAYHEYYTNDDMGLVQLNDSLFFDLTEYLISQKEGFLLLKKGMMENHPVASKEVLINFYK